MKLLIKNGTVVDPVNRSVRMDVLVEDGWITRLEPQIDVAADKVIDARGLFVSPGLVDMHVHLRDPGQTEKEDILSGCAAAARGGVTALACMANTKPVVDTPELVTYIIDRSKEGCGVRVYPIAAVSKGLAGQELTAANALKQAGAVALSDDGCNVDSAELMRNAMIKAKGLDMPILCHCEVSDMVENRAVNEGSVSRQLWLEGRPAIAEELAVMRDGMLSQETGARVHICHVSTAKSVDIIRQLKKQGIPITCETCPQYFTITEDEILKQEALARVNPPLRTAKDVRGIIAGLRDGTIDAIPSNHAPHTEEEKGRGLARAPSGMVGLETSLALALTALYHPGKLELYEIIRLMSSNPAAILRVGGGRIAIGGEADLVLFDPEEEWTVNPAHFVSKGRNTPFGGWKLQGRVKYTLVGGRVVYQREGTS